jgi:cell fate regulator YaaT (PSP1 superfamily)
MGHVGRFVAVDAVRYRRGMQVIVRTSRGLEKGEVLTPVDDASERGQTDGSILRGMTSADRLLEARLEKNRLAAFEACQAELDRLGSSLGLVDVEQLFDGQSLYFYFLGETTPEIQEMTERLAQVYDATAQLSKFAETLTNGCGPGCGTESASGGGGCSTCASGGGCAVASACGKRTSGS